MEGRIIEICCDNQIEQWRSRELAKSFYLEAAMGCESAEHERHFNIYCQLSDGENECFDEERIWFDINKRANNYRRFPNGTPVRDLYGKIEFPLPAY